MPTKLVARLTLSLLGLASLLPGVARADEALRERLEQLRGMSPAVVAGARLSAPGVLADFYRQRDYRFAWGSGRRVDDLLGLAERSREDGLEASDFNSAEIIGLVRGRNPYDLPLPSRVDADLLLSDGLLRLIHYYKHGKVDPQAIDRKWNHAERPDSTALVGDLQRVAEAQDLDSEILRLMPRPVFYTRLKEGLALYRGIAAAGGWPAVPSGASLKPGMSDARVSVMRERLRATADYVGGGSDSPVYDPELEQAVIGFQQRHYLGVDGIVGPATLAAMNVSAEQRVDQIRVNLERMRWVSEDLPDDFLLVDIAGQKVNFFRDGNVIWSSRVIVGRQERPTPVFRDQVEYLEFNPTWTVPPTILKRDILPNARKNPDYVSKKGLEVLTRSGDSVSPQAVDWSAPANNFPYMLRQPPGKKNALGQVKFMFPNRYSVYLHDTPSRNLFQKPRRLYSSGCVRVERPMELAELVLGDPRRWNQESLERIVASQRTRWVHLKEPLPVILSYWTADAGEDGKIRFREDVYARDTRVLTALNGGGSLRVAPGDSPSSEPAADTAVALSPLPAPEMRTGALSHSDPASPEQSMNAAAGTAPPVGSEPVLETRTGEGPSSGSPPPETTIPTAATGEPSAVEATPLRETQIGATDRPDSATLESTLNAVSHEPPTEEPRSSSEPRISASAEAASPSRKAGANLVARAWRALVPKPRRETRTTTSGFPSAGPLFDFSEQ